MTVFDRLEAVNCKVLLPTHFIVAIIELHEFIEQIHGRRAVS